MPTLRTQQERSEYFKAAFLVLAGDGQCLTVDTLAALFTELAMLVNAQGEVRPHDPFGDLGCINLTISGIWARF